MHTVIKKLTNLAAATLRTNLNHASEVHGFFRLMTTAVVDGEEKPVLVVGNSHTEFDDGHAIVVLNPDASLATEIKAGTAYGSANLKAIARGRCDALVDVFMAGISQRVPHLGCGCAYQAQKPHPARFPVQ